VRQQINQYLGELDKLKKVGGTHRESVVREAFKDLLKRLGNEHHLVFIAEYELDTATKDRRYVDGALLHELRVPFGYLESKDTKDDIDVEIALKFKRGYPQDNIIFEDSTQAVLIQHRNEVMRCPVDDVKALEKLLHLFFAYQRPEIEGFRKAVEQFRTDIPAVLEALRAMIEVQHGDNKAFRKASAKFLTHAQEAINPSLTDADVREMLIQHILTEEIFSKVFDDSDFHRQNNVARELYRLEETFFTGTVKRATLKGLEPYYAAIRTAAAQISSHHEKQTFLKVIYENFYKVYNAKAADRLGVVYTPNEVVRFMIDGADWLVGQHFDVSLVDRDVEILDPAVGTGTFICELIEHFRGQPKKLERKYREELHANEVAILPYYVANLNIESTYASVTGGYEEFKNLCFVDTLENVGTHTSSHGVTLDLFGSVSEENVARINRQNQRRISVVIGNPPYRANQANESENNKNRKYPHIDERVKQTYIAASTAQKSKAYDPFIRFFRWATDRLSTKGALVFITNRRFIDGRTFDGFRKTVATEFEAIYLVDLGGDVRANPSLSGSKHNVFGIQTGVAISFMVRNLTPGAKKKPCRVFYAARPMLEVAEEKLSYLANTKLADIKFDELKPDARGRWLEQGDKEFDDMLALASKDSKLGVMGAKAAFKLFSLGIVTNRDDWVYSHDAPSLLTKVDHFIDLYASEMKRWHASSKHQASNDFVDRGIKWTSELESHMKRGTVLKLDQSRVFPSLYRPFVKRWTYFAPVITHRPYQHLNFFPSADTRNPGFSFSAEDRASFAVIAFDQLPNKDMFLPNAGQTVCRWRWEADGTKVDNVSDWVLKEFTKHYQGGRAKRARPIAKDAIFDYIYGILHDPVYRKKYMEDLQFQLPRVPCYGTNDAEFWRWADWGEQLRELHVNFEKVVPLALRRIDKEDAKSRAAGEPPKCSLKADKTSGRIIIDSETTLLDIPTDAWQYQLGNRCAIEWVLDQYKDYTPRDRMVKGRLHTYRFANHKEEVIDLIARVANVSVQTVAITREMERVAR
jgi:predicted helicase